MNRIAALALASALLPACASEPTPAPVPLSIPEGCQPLTAGTSCTLPYPSDFFLETDAAMPSGHRIILRGAAKPRTLNDLDADVTGPFAPDGASLQPTLAAVLPGTPTANGLPNVLDDATVSTNLASSPTLLLREDGTPIAHYVDVDPKPGDEGRIAITLRPFAPLDPKTHYVAVLRGVRIDGDGSLAAPAEGFRRLRDRQLDLDPSLRALAPRFERDVFAPLAKAGVAREPLQLAWDFTTGSRERPTADMLRVRELTLAWLSSHVPKVTVTGSDPPTSDVARIVRGTIEGPRWVDRDGVGAMLHRDGNGAVAENGTTIWDFVAVVPSGVLAASTPGRALAFGHGFFGSRDELVSTTGQKIASRLGAVAIGIDWWGMSKPDLDAVIASVTDTPARTTDFVERVHQAMSNWIVTTAALRGPMTSLAAMKGPTDAVLYDPAHVYYFGASQAHILGGVMCALNPDVERAVLNVGGAAFTHIMPRSNAFAAFQFILGSTVNDQLTLQTVLPMLAAGLDRIDPASYASWLVGSKLPQNPDRRVLLQVGIGDSSVPTIAGFFHARALGLSQTSPPAVPVLGVPAADASGLTSAITMYDFGIPLEVYRSPVSKPDNEVHNGLRVEDTALAQMDAFLKPDGVVIHPCNGVCRVRP